MPDKEMLRTLAAKHPTARRVIAEYSDEGRPALDRFMLHEPVAAVAFMADLFELMQARRA